MIHGGRTDSKCSLIQQAKCRRNTNLKEGMMGQEGVLLSIGQK